MQKIRLFYWFVLEICLIKKSCNMIGLEHFGPYPKNKNFPKYAICAGPQQIIWISSIDQIQQKLMTKFSNKLKKPCFWPILALFPNFGKKNFPEYPALPGTTSYEFLAPCQISEKFNDTIPRKRLDRRTDGRTDRPYFIGPFRLPPRVQ